MVSGRCVVQWFSGKIQRCHRWAPSSILGWTISFGRLTPNGMERALAPPRKTADGGRGLTAAYALGGRGEAPRGRGLTAVYAPGGIELRQTAGAGGSLGKLRRPVLEDRGGGPPVSDCLTEDEASRTTADGGRGLTAAYAPGGRGEAPRGRGLTAAYAPGGVELRQAAGAGGSLGRLRRPASEGPATQEPVNTGKTPLHARRFSKI